MHILHNNIHICYTYPSKIDSTEIIGRCESILGEEELRKYTKFKFRKDRLQYLATRAQIRLALSEYTGRCPAELVFCSNKYGKPYLSNALSKGQQSLYFNISHSRNLIVSALCSGNEIGIDVEPVNRSSAVRDLENSYMSSDESHRVSQLPPQAADQHALELWTLKESFTKALGKGMSIPFQKLTFLMEQNTSSGITLNCCPSIVPNPQDWYFQFLDIDKHYMIALCCKILSYNVRPNIYCYEFTPFVDSASVKTRDKTRFYCCIKNIYR
jgi:4'-phosphopantetheinyl transferase